MHAILSQPELVLEIAEACDVQHVVILSMVLSSLHHLIQNSRSLWLYLLRKAAMEECLAPFSISYALLTTKDLIRYATRPLRLRAALMSKRRIHVPGQEFSLSPCLPPGVEGGAGLRVAMSSACLLRGGRWLVAGIMNEDHDIYFLACWDLQQLSSDSCGTSTLQPAALIPWDGEHAADLELKQASMADRVSLAVSTQHSSKITLFELIWADGKNTRPQFLEVFSSEDEPNARGICVDGPICISRSKTALRVWDWKQKSEVVEFQPYQSQNHQIDALWLHPPNVSILSKDDESVQTYTLPRFDDNESQIFVKHKALTDTIEWGGCNRNFLLYEPSPWKRQGDKSDTTLVWHRSILFPGRGYTVSLVFLRLDSDGVITQIRRHDIGPATGERVELVHPELAILVGSPSNSSSPEANVLSVPITTLPLRDNGDPGHVELTTDNHTSGSMRARPGLCPVSGKMLLHGASAGSNRFRLLSYL